MSVPPYINPKVAEWFWAKVERGAGADDCWRWTASTDARGYGRLSVGKGRPERAPRVSWYLHHGVWPERHILHTCDNPECTNPRHLYEGGHPENSRDAVERGRQARGERHGRRSHTWDEVVRVRAAHASGEGGYDALAQRFAVSRSWVAEVIQGKVWKHQR